MSSPDPAISDVYAVHGPTDAPGIPAAPGPAGAVSPASRVASEPTPAPLAGDSSHHLLVWGYLVILAGFGGALFVPKVPTVLGSLIFVGLCMAAMVVGMGMVLFAMIRNAIRSL